MKITVESIAGRLVAVAPETRFRTRATKNSATIPGSEGGDIYHHSGHLEKESASPAWGDSVVSTLKKRKQIPPCRLTVKPGDVVEIHLDIEPATDQAFLMSLWLKFIGQSGPVICEIPLTSPALKI